MNVNRSDFYILPKKVSGLPSEVLVRVKSIEEGDGGEVVQLISCSPEGDILLQHSWWEADVLVPAKERCSGVDRYKAMMPPRCGCIACHDKWRVAQRA